MDLQTKTAPRRLKPQICFPSMAHCEMFLKYWKILFLALQLYPIYEN